MAIQDQMLSGWGERATSIISQLLQDEWSLSSPDVDDIGWSSTRVEAMDFTKIAKNFFVACYNLMWPVNARPYTVALWWVEENVIVDILVKVTSSVDDAADLRELIRSEIYRIIHENETNIDDFILVRITREPYKVEAPDIVRETIQVTCTALHSGV